MITRSTFGISITVAFIFGTFFGISYGIDFSKNIAQTEIQSYNIVDFCEENGYDYVKKRWNEYFCIRQGDNTNEVMIVPLEEL